MYNEAGYSYQFVRHYEQSTKLRDGGCKVLLGQVKKKGVLVSRPDFYKKRGGRAVFFLLFIISFCMLSSHIITFPQGYVRAIRSNINKTKRPILIKHKFV